MEPNQRDLRKKTAHISLKTFLLIELSGLFTFPKNLLFVFFFKNQDLKLEEERWWWALPATVCAF